MMQLALIVTMVGSITAAIHKGSGGTSWAFSSDGLLHRQAVTPRKPGDGATHQAVSSALVAEVGSDLMFKPLTPHLPAGIKLSSPQNSYSALSLKRCEESVWQLQLAWRGVTPPSTQGIDLGAVHF